MSPNERSKARYWHMVNNRICPMCGYALPSDYYYVYCEYCRKRKVYYAKNHKSRYFKDRLDRNV
jgi:uncharacterized CHY-type Zn-finger protein